MRLDALKAIYYCRYQSHAYLNLSVQTTVILNLEVRVGLSHVIRAYQAKE